MVRSDRLPLPVRAARRLELGTDPLSAKALTLRLVAEHGVQRARLSRPPRRIYRGFGLLADDATDDGSSMSDPWPSLPARPDSGGSEGADMPTLTTFTVMLDYGQFYLHTAAPEDPEDVVRLLHEAIDGTGIAQNDSTLVVRSPHQNNFAMHLDVEQWDRRPPDDDDAWEEVFTASATVTDQGLFYESPTLAVTDLEVPAGTYDLRISGRGFVNHGWPGSTEPGDVWRLQLWPGGERHPPRHVRVWPGPAGS